MVGEVELDRFVVNVHVGKFGAHVFEADVFPGVWVFHHDFGGVVVFVVLDKQETELVPSVNVLANADEFRNVDALRK